MKLSVLAKYFLIDSYEVWNQNWSENFRTDLIKLKGYAPVTWLMNFNETIKKGYLLVNTILQVKIKQSSKDLVLLLAKTISDDFPTVVCLYY